MEASSQPNTSKKLDSVETAQLNSQDYQCTLPPTVKEEEAEIYRLEGERKSNAEVVSHQEDHTACIKFVCSSCELSEYVHFYGKKPDFAYGSGVKFFEDTYVMRDPFKPPPPRWKQKPEHFIAIGAKCSKCSTTVCHDAECSFFYTRTYCLSCAQQELKSLPPEAQLKLRKQLQAKQIK